MLFVDFSSEFSPMKPTGKLNTGPERHTSQLDVGPPRKQTADTLVFNLGDPQGKLQHFSHGYPVSVASKCSQFKQ